MKDKKVDYTVTSVERAFRLLEEVTRKDYGVSELARATGMHKATVHRLLMTLAQMGYVRSLDNGATYTVGFRLLTLGGTAMARLDLRRIARPYLEALRDETRATVHLGILDGDEVVYIDKVESPSNIRMASYVGARVSVHSSAMGKVILAFLPPEERHRRVSGLQMVPRTERTITVPEQMLAELDTAQTRGYALDLMENEEGIHCIGAPIFDHRGTVQAAVSVSGPFYEIDEARIPDLAPRVLATAAQISRELGWPGSR